MKTHNDSRNSNLLFFIIGIIVIALTLRFFPVEYIQSNALADNPEGAPYYISLQTILANYPQLSFDHANAVYIKNRLLQFENDVNQFPTSATAVAYKNDYNKILKQQGFHSVSGVNDIHAILALAKASYIIVDHFYLDKRLFKVGTLYRWNPHDTRRILNFNLGSLYYDLIPDKYARILFAVNNGLHLGSFPGFFVNNQTTGLGTQFMTGIPLLTALYVLPKYNFSLLGSYNGLVPWCAFWTKSVTDPTERKILNIAGIDYFTLSKSEVNTLIKKGEIKKIPDAVPVNSRAPQFFDNGSYQTYFNSQSYGLVYLANHVTYIDPREMKPYEGIIKQYFAKPDQHDPEKFTTATNEFYNKLMNLKSKHDVLIEAVPPVLGINMNNKGVGSVAIKGIIGGRALFDSNCMNEKGCTFVVNIAKANGWHAIVNNHAERISRTNFAFMSVNVPSGHSTVWFIYESLPGLLSYLLSMFSLIAVFLYLERKLNILMQR